jgi:hypothetical protein
LGVRSRIDKGYFLKKGSPYFLMGCGPKKEDLWILTGTHIPGIMDNMIMNFLVWAPMGALEN